MKRPPIESIRNGLVNVDWTVELCKYALELEAKVKRLEKALGKILNEDIGCSRCRVRDWFAKQALKKADLNTDEEEPCGLDYPYQDVGPCGN